MKSFVLILAAGVLVGCASTLKIPDDAKLVYYGPANGMQLGLTEEQGGMIYVRRGHTGPVVIATPVGEKGLNVSGLKPTGNYCVYWKPW